MNMIVAMWLLKKSNTNLNVPIYQLRTSYVYGFIALWYHFHNKNNVGINGIIIKFLGEY